MCDCTCNCNKNNQPSFWRSFWPRTISGLVITLIAYWLMS